ncbi:hypothetical protein [Photobacterium sanguinicancri]|uniref:OmpR/PhoB-type domain-containing protein n=1 Tax=Photobacterium sanguinicancri TaxID=875932 RepID=A0AAW7Y8S8_9GAMM|nr:hypothetical protein [Photobacterium sanguinicancri]KXI23526.1 hypothetical protein AS132_06780 [Photobacterium sanguinicancri]MDO6543944.1 hypothetical protein [Photobacterium sanguinicancri]
MTTKALTRCYRFPSVDFEPDLRILVWQDGSETLLTVHESRLLEALCYCAGEVVNPQALYSKTFIQLDSYEENNQSNFDLNALLVSLNHKLSYQDQPAIAIEVVTNHGFRVPLPSKTCRLVHTFKQSGFTQFKNEAVEQEEDNQESATEHIVKHSMLHKISVLLLAAAGVALFFLADNILLS